MYLRIPRAKLAEAKLSIDCRWVIPDTEVALSEVSRLGAWAVGGDKYGAECVVARFGLQSRYPSSLNAKDCSFAVAPDADRNSMMYNLQIVTMDGKTWRSRPIVMEKPSDKVRTVVQAALKERAVQCELPRARVPRLEYDFSPEAGDVMRPASGERHFFGLLGSTAALASLWNRGSSLEGPFPRGGTFWRQSKGSHPLRAKSDTGVWELVFDGVDDFVSFPHETVPQWSAATIELEFCQSGPGAARAETLFTVRHVDRVGLYEIVLDKGEIVVSGYAAVPRAFGQNFEFRTGFKAAPGSWHSLIVRHDGKDMIVTLDGRTARKAVDLPAVFMNTAILGGTPSTATSFFTGKVRKLVIDHAVTQSCH